MCALHFPANNTNLTFDSMFLLIALVIKHKCSKTKSDKVRRKSGVCHVIKFIHVVFGKPKRIIFCCFRYLCPTELTFEFHNNKRLPLYKLLK